MNLGRTPATPHYTFGISSVKARRKNTIVFTY